MFNTMLSIPNATLAPGMFKLDIEPISARLKNNRDAHKVYIEKTIEYADTLRRFVKRARTLYLSEPLLESACMFTKHVHELLDYASQTCPNSPKTSEKLVDVQLTNKHKRVRFAKPVTSSNNIPMQTDSFKTKDSNKPLLKSTGVKPTTIASRSKPSGNTKNNRISRPPHSNQKNKVEDNSMIVKSCLTKTNFVFEPISYPDRPLVYGLRMFKTYDREPLLAHELCVKESPKTSLCHDDLLHEFLHEDSTSQGSSSNVRPSHTPFELIGRWNKDHPIINVIDNPFHSVFTRKQLKTDAMWCYFDAFLTSLEPKNVKQAVTKPSWIEAMQEEIHEFKRLQV
nr:hypothetical protein [Tanacetum cinerariifolium]